MTWEIFIASPHHASHLDHNRFKNIKRIQIFLIRYCYWQEKSRFCLKKIVPLSPRRDSKKQFISRMQRPWHVIFRERKNAFLENISRERFPFLSAFIYLFIYFFILFFFLVLFFLFLNLKVVHSRKCTGTEAGNCTDHLCTRERFAFHSGIIISLRSVMIPFAQ